MIRRMADATLSVPVTNIVNKKRGKPRSEVGMFDVPDHYTTVVLKERFEKHKEYISSTLETKKATGINFRLPNMPEDISENIAKFIIQNHVGDKSSKWTKGICSKGQKISGDLISEKEGTQEVKWFASDGPSSFGPKEKWNVIYFLDGRNWLDDKFILWRVPLSNDSAEWKSLKVNKNQTYEEQSGMGRRPRNNWDDIKEQIGSYATLVFEGKFDEIFIPREETLIYPRSA